jgi:hypothetical protein
MGAREAKFPIWEKLVNRQKSGFWLYVGEAVGNISSRAMSQLGGVKRYNGIRIEKAARLLQPRFFIAEF